MLQPRSANELLSAAAIKEYCATGRS